MFLIRLVFSALFALCFLINGSALAAKAHHRSAKRVAGSQVVEKVNLNTADIVTIEKLKGIGPSKARAIVDYRKENGKFKTLDDLTAVRGIGAKFLARLQKFNPGRVTVN